MSKNGPRPERTGRRDFIRKVSVLSAATVTGCQSGRPASHARRGRLATFCCDVTPPLGTPIYSSYKPLATVEHPLLAKGVVLRGLLVQRVSLLQPSGLFLDDPGEGAEHIVA